jgi:hypothetical protein
MQAGFPLPKPEGTSEAPPPMIYVREQAAWEYRVVSRSLATQAPPEAEELNALGAEGWELAGVLKHKGRASFYFKRAR